MIVWLTNITFASNVIGDVPSSSNENRTLNRETTIYNWTCDITQDLAFYNWSPVYLRVGQPKWPVSYVFDKTETYVRGYNQSTFVGNIKFPYVSNFVPSTTIDSDSSNILTVDATGATLLWSVNTTRNQAAGQFVTFNNERSIVQNANGVLLNYYYIRANDLSLHNGALNVIINPSITKKISCTNYYVARCGDGVIDKQTGTSDGNWWLTNQWWIFLPWHGNSIKPNEVCDDWAQNGQAGKCKTDCTGIGGGTETGNLVVTKTLTVDQNYAPGDNLQFRVSFSNPSTQTVQNISIEDFLPSGLEYISSEIFGATAPTYFSTGTVSGTLRIAYTGFSLAAGQNGYILINAKLLACNAALNNVIWTAVSNGQNLGWNANKQVLCSGGTPVSIAKTANKLSVQWWEIVTYTITATNNTPNSISNVFIQDIWPVNWCILMTGNWTSTNSSLQLISTPWASTTQWGLASLGANATISLTFYGQASTSPSCVWNQTNIGQIIYNGNQPIPSSATVNITQAIGGITIIKKIEEERNYWPWDTVVYIITYKNEWKTDIGSFIIKDYWPDNSVRFLNSNPNPRPGGNPNVLIWDINGLKAGAQGTIRIVGTIRANLQ